MPGPRPKPTRLKRLAGNPGKRPLNRNEPEPEPGIPSVPAHLDDEAKAEWGRISEELDALGLLTSVDRAALAAYCQAWSTWVESVEKLRSMGKIIKSPSGYPMVNPYVAIHNKALDHMHKYAVEFGLTPASRSRISVQPKRKKANRFEGL